MPAENSPTPASSIAEDDATLTGQRGEREGIPAPAEGPACACPERGSLPERACANLCLLYQGVPACASSPYSRPTSEHGGTTDA